MKIRIGLQEPMTFSDANLLQPISLFRLVQNEDRDSWMIPFSSYNHSIAFNLSIGREHSIYVLI